MSTLLDFRPLVDVNPYIPPPNWTVAIGIPKIAGLNGTGLLRVAEGSGGRMMMMSEIPTTPSATKYTARWQVGYSQGGSDYSGAVLLDAAGTGFGIANQGTTLKMFNVTTYAFGSEIWSATIPAAVAGDWFNFVFDINTTTPASSSLKIFQESVSTVTPATTRTRAYVAGMRIGALCNSSNINAEGLQQIQADYGNPLFDSITPAPAIGDSITFTTSGLSTLTNMTVGGVAVNSLSATGGDGTCLLQSWVVGNVGIPLGTQYVVASDGTVTTGVYDKTIVINAPTGKQFVQLTTVNPGAAYLSANIVAAGGTALAIGDQIQFSTATALGLNPATQVSFIDDDGGIYTDYVGTQTILVRRSGTGIVETHSLITAEGPANSLPVVSASTIKSMTLGITATDPDGDALVYSVTTQGSKGTASVAVNTIGKVKYTPNTNATGTDSFTVKVSDGRTNGDVYIVVTVNIDTWVMSTSYGTTPPIIRN